MKSTTALALVPIVAALTATALADMDIGDVAPPLTVSKWVKGTPVDLGAVKGKNINVIEFWATWCGPCIQAVPHMTELQHKYRDKGVTFVGVSAEDPGNTLEKVSDFVKSQGDKMDYTVAFDAGSKTYDAYMKSFGQDGIPTAFIVDKTGRVAWIGHPMNGMEDALDEMVSGSFDIEVAKKMNALNREENEAWMRGDFNAILAVADKRIALKPKSGEVYASKFFALTQAGSDDKAALAAASEAVELWKAQPEKLARFAPNIARKEDTLGFNDLARKAMSRALELKPNDSNFLISQFQVLAAVGEDQAAIAAAEKGIEALRQNKDAAGLSKLAAILSDPRLDNKCGELALRSVDLALQSEPDNPKHLMGKFSILVMCMKDTNGAKATGQYLIEKVVDDDELLNGFAWNLLTEPSTKGQFNELALQAAVKCDQISGGTNWMFVDTLALAKFETGSVKEAIVLEEKAIELGRTAKANASFMADMEAALARFKATGSDATSN